MKNLKMNYQNIATMDSKGKCRYLTEKEKINLPYKLEKIKFIFKRKRGGKMNSFKNPYYDRKGPDKKVIEKKIKGMFDAVFKPRDEFMGLSKSSQDLLLGCLQDDIVEGFLILEKEVFRKTYMI